MSKPDLSQIEADLAKLPKAPPELVPVESVEGGWLDPKWSGQITADDHLSLDALLKMSKALDQKLFGKPKPKSAEDFEAEIRAMQQTFTKEITRLMQEAVMFGVDFKIREECGATVSSPLNLVALTAAESSQALTVHFKHIRVVVEVA